MTGNVSKGTGICLKTNLIPWCMQQTIMNGTIIWDIPAAIDYWRVPPVGLCFLTHCHEDHMVGLSESWNHPIYCSNLSAAILSKKIKIRPNLLKPLEIGQSYILPVGKQSTQTVTVNVIEANHCPGAIMFLFHGVFGQILYTGDFRYYDTMFTIPPLSLIKSGIFQISTLYLDNTYCNFKKYFMSQEEAEQKIFDIIEKNPGNNIVIGLRNLGKESLLVKIALRFNTWIVVTPHRYELLEILGLPNVFTTDQMKGHIRVAFQSEVSADNLEFWNSSQPTIGIVPTALYFPSAQQPRTNHAKLHVVPYSDHCSFQELHKFVGEIRPCRIKPIVKSSVDCSVSVFNRYLDKSSPHKHPPKPVTAHANQMYCTIRRYINSQRPMKPPPLLFKRRKKITMGVVFDEVKDISSPAGFSMKVNEKPSTQQTDFKLGILKTTHSKEFTVPVVVIEPDADSDEPRQEPAVWLDSCTGDVSTRSTSANTSSKDLNLMKNKSDSSPSDKCESDCCEGNGHVENSPSKQCELNNSQESNSRETANNNHDSLSSAVGITEISEVAKCSSVVSSSHQDVLLLHENSREEKEISNKTVHALIDSDSEITPATECLHSCSSLRGQDLILSHGTTLHEENVHSSPCKPDMPLIPSLKKISYEDDSTRSTNAFACSEDLNFMKNKSDLSPSDKCESGCCEGNGHVENSPSKQCELNMSNSRETANDNHDALSSADDITEISEVARCNSEVSSSHQDVLLSHENSLEENEKSNQTVHALIDSDSSEMQSYRSKENFSKYPKELAVHHDISVHSGNKTAEWISKGSSSNQTRFALHVSSKIHADETNEQCASFEKSNNMCESSATSKIRRSCSKVACVKVAVAKEERQRFWSSHRMLPCVKIVKMK